MKKLVICCMSWSLFFLLFSACSKEPLVTDETVHRNGDLTFQIHCNGNPVGGASIGITTDEPDDPGLVYYQIKETDDSGQVSFADIEPGVYYWKIQFRNATAFVDLGLGAIEVTAGGKHGMPVFINDTPDCN